MWQTQVQVQLKTLTCPICLDLLKDPVTLTCGHNFCKDCIKGHWDTEDVKESYSCPQCREPFMLRPTPKKNTMLAELVEELKEDERRAEHFYAGDEDVACDVCTGRKLKALKFCNICLASFCEEHLQPHYQSPPFQKHELVEASNDGSQMSAAAERMLKKRVLDLGLKEIQQRVQHRDKGLKVLQQEMKTIGLSADKALQDTDEIFNEMMSILEKKRCDLRQQMESKKKAEVSRVKDLEKNLQRESDELKQRSLTPDHNQSALSPSTQSSSFNVRSLSHFDEVTESVEKLSIQVQDIVDETSLFLIYQTESLLNVRG